MYTITCGNSLFVLCIVIKLIVNDLSLTKFPRWVAGCARINSSPHNCFICKSIVASCLLNAQGCLFKALCYVLAILAYSTLVFVLFFNRRDLKPKLHGVVFVPKTVLNYLPVARL